MKGPSLDGSYPLIRILLGELEGIPEEDMEPASML
jgi:hypothetical protein